MRCDNALSARKNIGAYNCSDIHCVYMLIRDFISFTAKQGQTYAFVGPTGAGKTTTLYAALREINTIDSKVLTAEDPVE